MSAPKKITTPDVVFLREPRIDAGAIKMMIQDHFGTKVEYRSSLSDVKNLEDKAVLCINLCPSTPIDALPKVKAWLTIDNHYDDPEALPRHLEEVSERKHTVFAVIATKETECGALTLFKALNTVDTPVPFWLVQLNKLITSEGYSRTEPEKAIGMYIMDKLQSLRTSDEAVPVFRALSAQKQTTAEEAGMKILSARRPEMKKMLDTLAARWYCSPITAGKDIKMAYIDVPDFTWVRDVSTEAFSVYKNVFSFVAIRWVDASGVTRIGLRRPHGSDINILAIAKLNGGGGIADASGVQGRKWLTNESLLALISTTAPAETASATPQTTAMPQTTVTPQTTTTSQSNTK